MGPTSKGRGGKGMEGQNPPLGKTWLRAWRKKKSRTWKVLSSSTTAAAAAEMR